MGGGKLNRVRREGGQTIKRMEGRGENYKKGREGGQTIKSRKRRRANYKEKGGTPD